MSDSRDAVLLYDGSCGFCQANVQFILRHERRSTLRFAPLQGEFARTVIERNPSLSGVDSVVWVDDPGGDGESVAVKSAAARKAIGYLGGAWPALLVLWVFPRPLRDGVYDFIARHRHRLVPGGDSCALPDRLTRERFLD